MLFRSFLIIPSPIPMYITYGMMQGFGQGMIYTVIVATAQRWFPDKTGFASGVIVTANGLCGLFMAPISRGLLEMGGLQVTFIIIGIVMAISWVLCSIFCYVPDREWYANTVAALNRNKVGSEATKMQKQYTASEMFRTRKFYLLLATMLFGIIAYFMLSPVSQTHQIDLGIQASIAVSAVMCGSILNAGVRLLLPALADKVGRIVCIKWVLVVSVIAMGILSVSSTYAVTVAIVLMYGCYGGIMGSFPSLTSSIFGIEHSGENYGYVMMGMIFATFGALGISNVILGMGYTMQNVFAVGIVSGIIAFGCLILLERELKGSRKEQKNGFSNNERIIGASEK